MLKTYFAKLLKVKSIITLVLTGVFAYLSIVGNVNAESFMDIFKLIIIFYFGSQVGKREVEEELENGKGKT